MTVVLHFYSQFNLTQFFDYTPSDFYSSYSFFFFLSTCYLHLPKKQLATKNFIFGNILQFSFIYISDIQPTNII